MATTPVSNAGGVGSIHRNVGHIELDTALNLVRNGGTAKNVIIFIGDGMGVNTVTTSRIFRAGEESFLSFETFPHVGMLKVTWRIKMFI